MYVQKVIFIIQYLTQKEIRFWKYVFFFLALSMIFVQIIKLKNYDVKAEAQTPRSV